MANIYLWTIPTCLLIRLGGTNINQSQQQNGDWAHYSFVVEYSKYISSLGIMSMGTIRMWRRDRWINRSHSFQSTDSQHSSHYGRSRQPGQFYVNTYTVKSLLRSARTCLIHHKYRYDNGGDTGHLECHRIIIFVIIYCIRPVPSSSTVNDDGDKKRDTLMAVYFLIVHLSRGGVIEKEDPATNVFIAVTPELLQSISTLQI